jgi:hypothetical protein
MPKTAGATDKGTTTDKTWKDRQEKGCNERQEKDRKAERAKLSKICILHSSAP